MRTGWYGTIMDNAKGNMRMVDVEGLYRETGSVYSHDILYCAPEGVAVDATVDDSWLGVELSDRQKKVAQRIRSSGF